MMDCTERDSNRSISAEAAQRVHLILEGHVLRTVATRLQDLAYLAMRGARQAGPEPAKVAIQERDGRPVLDAGQAVEIDRKVHRDGLSSPAGTPHRSPGSTSAA
jgi:hypothetical protein